MSRFIEVFEAYRSDLSMQHFLKMLETIRGELDAETAYSDIHFPYFIQKTAPVSGQPSIMSYDCSYEARSSAAGHSFIAGVTVPVQTVCPCSKAISAHGAHNQRGLVTLKVKLGPFFWFEDMIALVEDSASSDLYTLLKREDEKYVTERSYERPRFVEDVVRGSIFEGGSPGEIPQVLRRGGELREHPQSFSLCVCRKDLKGVRMSDNYPVEQKDLGEKGTKGRHGRGGRASACSASTRSSAFPCSAGRSRPASSRWARVGLFRQDEDRQGVGYPAHRCRRGWIDDPLHARVRPLDPEPGRNRPGHLRRRELGRLPQRAQEERLTDIP